MPTTGTIIERARHELLAGVTEHQNKLSGAVLAAATTWTLTYELRAIRAGAVLECELEQVYVWSTNDSAQTAVVERAWNGTTAAAHADASIVTLHPRFPRADLLNWANDDLRDLSAQGLYRMLTVDVAYPGDATDLPVTFTQPPLDVYEIRYQTSAAHWPLLDHWELLRDQEAGDFPSGTGLRIYDRIGAYDLRVMYKAPFGATTALTDDIETVTGFPGDASPLLVCGIKILAGANREVKRNFTETQPEPRRSGEVPPDGVRNSYRGLAELRRNLIASEVTRLQQRYPTRRRW